MRSNSRYRGGIAPALVRYVLAAGAFACLVLGAGMFAAARAASPAMSVDAVIEPAQITLGESARMTVQSSGSNALSLTLPVVSGLEFRVVGQFHQLEAVLQRFIHRRHSDADGQRFIFPLLGCDALHYSSS